MTRRQIALLIAFGGIAFAIGGFALCNHLLKVKAARSDGDDARAPYFPPGAIWTRDVSRDRPDPNSAAIISTLAETGGWGLGRMQVDFSLRVLRANASTPSVPFHFSGGTSGPDGEKVTAVPLPDGGGVEGQSGYRCPGEDSDCHLIVVDRDHEKLYESYHANYSKGIVTGIGMVVWDLNRVYPPSGLGDQCSSADAAGFPIAPLLFNADELAAGTINHAIRFILPNDRIRANVFVHPATHAGAPRGSAMEPATGARFRLKASYDLSQLPPAARVVARAMQTYGMFLSDGGNVALTAQSDKDTAEKYSDVRFGSHDLQALKVEDFEVVDGESPIQLTYNCLRNR